MKHKILSFIGICLLTTSHLLMAQTIPFNVYLEPLNIQGLIGVQSFAFGQYNGKYLIVGGRLDGLHKSMGMGMMGSPFPSSSNNNSLIVIDPLSSQTWTVTNAALSTNIREQLSSTNTQYFQDGDYLYILGGYGYESAVNAHRTFDKLTAINVPNTINAIINGSSFTNYIRQITDEQFKVTGGQLEKIYDTYYLVGGHDFDGSYTSMGGMGMFTQTYTNQIRKFKIADNGIVINITHLTSITDSVNLHRRDYNLVPQIFPNELEGATVFSGVFQKNANIPYLNCINIDSGGYVVNNGFTQYYNHYQCANLPFYSTAQAKMFTLFFGGIAQYYDNAGVLTQDNNVPFVKTIACVTRDATGTMAEYKLPVELQALLGAGSELIPISTLSYYPNGVLKYDDLLQDTTLVGYILGGIKSPQPNVFSSGMMGTNGTSASNTLYKVFLVKNQANTSLIPSSIDNFKLQIYPNPSSQVINLIYETQTSEQVEVSVRNLEGILIYQELILTSSGKQYHQIKNDGLFKAGIYLISIKTDSAQTTQKLILH